MTVPIPRYGWIMLAFSATLLLAAGTVRCFGADVNCANNLAEGLIVAVRDTVGINDSTQLVGVREAVASACHVDETIARGITLRAFDRLCPSNLPCGTKSRYSP